MSAEFCRFSTPSSPLVSKHKHLPNPYPRHKQFPKFHNFLSCTERHTERENLNYKDGQTFIKAMKGENAGKFETA